MIKARDERHAPMVNALRELGFDLLPSAVPDVPAWATSCLHVRFADIESAFAIGLKLGIYATEAGDKIADEMTDSIGAAGDPVIEQVESASKGAPKEFVIYWPCVLVVDDGKEPRAE